MKFGSLPTGSLCPVGLLLTQEWPERCEFCPFFKTDVTQFLVTNSMIFWKTGRNSHFLSKNLNNCSVHSLSSQKKKGFYKKFQVSYFVNSQIWLNWHMDDDLLCYITGWKKEKKEHGCHTIPIIMYVGHASCNL